MRTLFALSLLAGFVFHAGAEEQPLLSPSLYIYGAYGSSTAEHPGDFAPGGHDPSREDAFILQAAEPSLSLRWGNHVEGFVNGLAYTDSQDNIEWEWEEYFLKLTDLPGGMELRGGRMLSRVGFHNATHLHSWQTVDAPLMHALFLGEDGLALEGGELSIYMETEQPTVLSIGFGRRPSHDHDHGHGEEEDHDDDHDHESEEHDHSDFGAVEAYRVMDDVITVGLRRDHVYNDFHKLGLAAFGGMGDNELGDTSWFAGAGVEYQWRENGFEPGGRALRWRTEMIRFYSDAGEDDDHDEDHEEDHDDDHADDHDDDHDGDHDHAPAMSAISSWGLTSELTYEAHPHFHPFLRFDYVAATDALDLSDWVRYSAGMTIPLYDNPGLFIRLQGNADERGDESEQSLWAQVGLSWGGGEVR